MSKSSDATDSRQPGSSVHGISQARILESVLISFSPGDLPDPGIEPRSPTSKVDSLPAEPQGVGEPMGKGLGPALTAATGKGTFNLPRVLMA